MTFYLKYRPQTIEELDLTQVRNSLQKIVQSGKIPHALLFSGPRGSGKTSTARIIAKAVNCESPAKGEPCNKCDQCKAITRGISLDVIEIDAASHRGVDDIRSLRETIKLAPAGSKKKVYIIDEAHMLTTEAFNALLKTLEEPPDHAMFILATTAPEKLPDTIKSRCTVIPFYKGTQEELIRALKKVVKGEKLKVESGSLEAIADLADGSFREAHKLLEQLSVEDSEITVEKVSNLSAIGINPEKLIESLDRRNVQEALQEIEKVARQGANLKLYITSVIAFFRKALLAQLGVGDKIETSFEGEELRWLIELFSEAVLKIPTSVIPQLPLEIAVVKWTSLAGPNPAQRGGMKIEEDLRNLAQTRDSGVIEQAPVQDGEVVVENTVYEEAKLEEYWKEIMKQTKSKNHSVEALLRASKPLGFDGKILQIEVFYKFHKDTLEKEANRRIVENVAGLVLGGTPRLVCVLSESKKRAADLVNLSEPKDEDIVKVAEEIFGVKGDGKVH